MEGTGQCCRLLLLLVGLLQIISASPAGREWRRARATRVLEEPYVVNLEQPQSQESLCRVNSSCTITCVFAGNPVQSVSLVKFPVLPGDAPKPMPEVPRTDKTTGAIRTVVFTLDQVAAEDDGRYCCMATNANKLALSIRTVTVFQPVSIVSTDVLHPSADETTYVCQASGLPLPTVSFVNANDSNPTLTESDPSVTYETVGDVIIARVTKPNSPEPVACVAHHRFGIESHKFQ